MQITSDCNLGAEDICDALKEQGILALTFGETTSVHNQPSLKDCLPLTYDALEYPVTRVNLFALIIHIVCRIRLVTHCQVSEDDVRVALACFQVYGPLPRHGRLFEVTFVPSLPHLPQLVNRIYCQVLQRRHRSNNGLFNEPQLQLKRLGYNQPYFNGRCSRPLTAAKASILLIL